MDFELAVIGGGMVGAATAALAARSGFEVALVEAHRPAQFDPDQPYDLRVSALSPGSRAILQEAGAWRLVERQRYAPYHRMHVEEEQGRGSIDFDADRFGWSELGFIVENQLTQWALWQSLEAGGQAELFASQKLDRIERRKAGVEVHLRDGSRFSAALAIGADGAASRVRRFCDTDPARWDYNQKGLVAHVDTAQQNDGIAWQRFLDTGPLAFLPLSDGRSSIVWTLPLALAEQMLELDDDAFLAELNAVAGDAFGEIQASSARAAFPLRMQLADRYVDDGIVLLGDAAHVVHPMAGQGVNLGLLDAAALIETLIRGRQRGLAPNHSAPLRRFERWRKSDNALMAGGIHAIKQLYALPAGPLGLIRRFGAGLVNRAWPVKERFLVHAAGQHADAPQIARGSRLKDISA